MAVDENKMEGMNIARISEDMFRINKYTFTKVPFLDVVTTSAPYFHFQILEPEDEEQRAKAINYFKENEKTYISFVDDTTILLFIGCTESIYIRSSINNDYDIEQLKSAMTDVSKNHRDRYFDSYRRVKGPVPMILSL